MAGPYTSEEVLAKHGKYFNVVQSFGLQQGNAADGSVKYRRIDDHTASHNNLAAHRRQKINMAMTIWQSWSKAWGSSHVIPS